MSYSSAIALSLATMSSLGVFVIVTLFFKYTFAKLPRVVFSKLYAALIGPLYVASWVLYPVGDDSLSGLSRMCSAGLLASLLTIGFAARGSIDSGVFLFGLAHCLLAMLFWRQPCAALASIFLSTGDAFAALMGAHTNILPRVPLPWNSDKTVAGLLGFVCSSLLVWTVVVGIYRYRGLWMLGDEGAELVQMVRSVSVTLLSALVESLPRQGKWDNLTVCMTPLLYGIYIDYTTAPTSVS